MTRPCLQATRHITHESLRYNRYAVDLCMYVCVHASISVPVSHPSVHIHSSKLSVCGYYAVHACMLTRVCIAVDVCEVSRHTRSVEDCVPNVSNADA